MGEDQKSANRVVRGGSWINNGRNVRSAYRNHNSPDNRNNIGLRLSLAQYRIGITVCDQIKPRLF
jgi:formylglycine-generating enzyme required for sulfatase activity